MKEIIVGFDRFVENKHSQKTGTPTRKNNINESSTRKKRTERPTTTGMFENKRWNKSSARTVSSSRIKNINESINRLRKERNINYKLGVSPLLEKRVKTKRKYTDNYPEKNMNSGAGVRNTVLSFMHQNEGKVKLSDMKEFLATVAESRGKSISRSWFSANKKYVTKVTEKTGTYYKLTSAGKKLIERLDISEDGATMDNTNGMGDVDMPSADKNGSGDRFDNKREVTEKSDKRAKLSDMLRDVAEYGDRRVEGEKVKQTVAKSLLKLYNSGLIDKMDFDASTVSKLLKAFKSMGLVIEGVETDMDDNVNDYLDDVADSELADDDEDEDEDEDEEYDLDDMISDKNNKI